MTQEYYYRYDAKRFSVTIDADAEIYGVSYPKLILQKFKVHSKTAKGVWISILWDEKDKWINNSSRKKFACSTEQAALEQYIARKKSYVRHAEINLNRAREDLVIGLDLLEKMKVKK